MAKRRRRRPLTFREKAIKMVRDNPIKAILIVLALFGGIPAATAGYRITTDALKPWKPAFETWVELRLKPIEVAQTQQGNSLDRFLLFQQQQALDKALGDPAIKTSPNAKQRVQELQLNIEDTKDRVCKANPKLLECRTKR